MKTALVTGATKGIGRGVAEMLLARGYRVIGTYAHDEEAARAFETTAAVTGGKLILLKADQARREETYALVEKVKTLATTLDCIVCNAALTVRKSFCDATDADWDAMFEVALHAHIILLRELFAQTARGARILFTGSAMGIYPHATVTGYGVTKAAVHALVKNLVKVYAPKEVTVNAIAPGFVETEWQQTKPQEIRENIYRKTAAHRFAQVDEVAHAFAFCLDNDFVNGSVVEVDGGYAYQ